MLRRRGFGLLEMLLVIGVLSAATSFTIPLYREYQIRGDLDNAAQLVTQGLGRARLLAQSGEEDGPWGFYIPAGTLYKGTGYDVRDQRFDEVFVMPSTIAISGLLDVSYSKIDGVPSTTGNIVLRALNNDERIIFVTIAVDTAQVATNESDTLTICHHPATNPVTLTIPEATWPTHQAHGDAMGACAGASSSSVSSAAATSSSSAASSVSSAASSSGGGGGGGGGGGSCKFTFASATQMITTTAATTVTFTNMLSQITFGAGGPQVSVHACHSINGGSSWSALFGGNGNCSGNGNAYGNAVKPNGTDTKTVSIASGKQVAVKVNGKYKQNGWLAFNETFTTVDNTGHIKVLPNGASLANYPGFGSQTPLKNYLIGQGMANAGGTITIGECDLLLIAELGKLGTSASDFQDDVMLVQFN